MTVKRLTVKLERLHAILQPAKSIPALAVVVQTLALGEGPILRAVAKLTLIHPGGAGGGGGLHVALLELPVLHAVQGLRVEHPGLAAVAMEAPAHEALAVFVTTALAAENGK